MKHMPDTDDVNRMIARAFTSFATRLADDLQIEHDRIMAGGSNAPDEVNVETAAACAGTLSVIIRVLRRAKP